MSLSISHTANTDMHESHVFMQPTNPQASLITAPDLQDLEFSVPTATERIQTYQRSYRHRAVPKAVSERLAEATAEIQEAAQVKRAIDVWPAAAAL